ncbi:MAG TPA: hypothetical protein VFO16_22060 [Pseudonocardiaceae bacterium]|nr:hypothetical protein [Pseudonocardiaceae bacterium]
MNPAIVINIYLNQDGTAASSSAPHAVVAQGASGTQPGIDIPPPPSTPVPPLPSEWSGQNVPPPPVLGAEPSGGDEDIPPPPNE